MKSGAIIDEYNHLSHAVYQLVSIATRVSVGIEEQTTREQLKRLGAIFHDADEDGHGGLPIVAFRKAMRMTMGDHVTDEELDMIFMKVSCVTSGRDRVAGQYQVIA